MKPFTLILLFILLPVVLFAQVSSGSDEKEWGKADSLLQQGFPESAGKIAQNLYDKARQRGDQVYMMKAQLFMMTASFQRSERAFEDAIVTAEQQSQTTSFPANAIWQSIAAQLYWNYYQQHRYNIHQRTRVEAAQEIADFAQWDASRFFARASALYKASLQQSAELEKIPIAKYDPLLIKGKNTRHLRPTLFDLLAFRAMDYLENDEKDITQPAFAFVMNDARAFSPASEFINTDFKTGDTTSLQYQALRLYQRILSLHIDDGSKDAMIDADLHRLQFAYNKSVHPDKSNLYKAALQKLADANASNPLSALASLRIAQIMMGTERTRADYDAPLGENEKKPTDFALIRKRLESIIAAHPKSEGGMMARQLLQQILAKDLNLVVEGVVLPGEPSRMLISYRNVPSASIRLVKLNSREHKWIGTSYGNTEKMLSELLKRSAYKQWETMLPSSGDYERHSTEVKIEALEKGVYAVIISANNDFSQQENAISYTVFQVSSLSIIRNETENFVLNRKTGVPVPDV
ncbi:MAG: hypothetical protein EOO01_00850, partial [Chitinophagaceae bacterium]